MTDPDIALLRKDVRAMKMQVIGQNMSLSDTEAQKFWPIYKHYADDLHESAQREVRTAEAVRGDVVNDDGPGCVDLCAALDGGGRGSAGATVEVCAGRDPSVTGKESSDVFSMYASEQTMVDQSLAKGEVGAAVDSSDASAWVVMTNDFRENFDKMFYHVSTDNGKTWTDDSMVGCNDPFTGFIPLTFQSDPGVSFDGAGNSYLSTITGNLIFDLVNGYENFDTEIDVA